MAKQEKTNSGRYAFLKNCKIEELEALLRMAMKDSPKDPEYLSALEAAILRQEQETPTGRLADVEEAWEQFCSTYLATDDDRFSLSEELERQKDPHGASAGSGRTKPRRIGRILLIAAVVVVLITLLLPPVLGYQNIFHMIGQWTSSAFQFDPAARQAENTSVSSALRESLEKYQIPMPLIPMWFPDGMQIQEVRCLEQEQGNLCYRAILSSKDSGHEIFFDVVRHTAPKSFVWEKDTGTVIEYPCGGVTHYIMTNNGQTSLHWYVDLTEVAVSGDIHADEAEKMIESIYEG